MTFEICKGATVQTAAKLEYSTPKIDKVAISKTETGAANPTEFLAIVGPVTS